MIILFIFILLIFFIINNILVLKVENFSNKETNINNYDTFYNFIKNNKNFKVLEINKSINYKNNNIPGFIGTNIYYKIYSKLDKKEYIILRYPDFKNEKKRHSIENINNYLIYIKYNYLKNDKNYILDFTGFHGYIDNKVKLWISIKNKYGRDKADEIMCKTYLCPNDHDIFKLNFNKNKKYVLKNSFGGARSALTITDSFEEINEHFNKNKSINFNPEKCEDAVCHASVKYNIVQDFIEPGLLIKNRKCGIRFYLIIFAKNKKLSGYLYKNGVCYYSKNDYNNTNNLENNVVGVSKVMKNFIEENNLPVYYDEYIEYIKKNHNINTYQINYFIKKLKSYCKIIINSVRDNLVFDDRINIKKYSVYALDVEYDKNFKPYIFEGNYYFARYKSNEKNGKLIMDMYNDIYYKLGLTNKIKYGFYNLYI